MSSRRSPGSRAARSVAFTRWAAPPGARSAPPVRPSPAPLEPRTAPRATASRSATRRPRSQGTGLLAVSGLAAHRHRANHLGAPVLQFLCRRHNRVPAHLESRSLASKCAGPLKPPARRGGSGCNVSQVGTLNQSGMRPAVRRCPRRAVARAEQAGDNRTSGITMNAPSAHLTAIARQPCAAQAGLVDPVAHRSPTRTR